MNLFDDITRTDPGSRSRTQPAFDFLNRSSRQDVDRIRELLESWFARYPGTEADELRSRFRSPSDASHQGAFFELFIHQVLVSLGCRVTVHPTPGDRVQTKPDFLVEGEGGDCAYVEARVVSNQSDAELKAEKRKAEVYDALNRTLHSPDFFVGLRLYGAPNTPPSAKDIKRFLESQLAGLDPDVVRAQIESGDEPQWAYEHDGWRIVFFPIPKGPTNRGKPGVRPLGVFAPGGPTPEIDTKGAIKKAVHRKATKYGQLDLPYVIALNALDWFTERLDVLDALFGTEAFVDTRDLDGRVERRMQRTRDGVWIGDEGPQNTRVSGVLLCKRVFPWTVSSADVRLYHNCFAAMPYDGSLTRLPQMTVVDDHFCEMAGMSLADVMELPDEFPDGG